MSEEPLDAREDRGLLGTSIVAGLSVVCLQCPRARVANNKILSHSERTNLSLHILSVCMYICNYIPYTPDLCNSLSNKHSPIRHIQIFLPHLYNNPRFPDAS